MLAAAALVALGPDLTGVLYAGTTVEGAHYIGLVTAAFALGLPAFSAQYIALRGFYAFEDTRTPFLLQVAIAATNVLLALVAYAVLPLRWRMVGVALAYSLTYLVGLALSTSVLRRRTGGLDGHNVVRHYVRLLAAAVPAGLLAAGGLAGGPVLGDGLGGSAASLLAAGGRSSCWRATSLLARLLRIRGADPPARPAGAIRGSATDSADPSPPTAQSPRTSDTHDHARCLSCVPPRSHDTRRRR